MPARCSCTPGRAVTIMCAAKVRPLSFVCCLSGGGGILLGPGTVVQAALNLMHTRMEPN